VTEEIDLWEELVRLSDQDKIPARLDSLTEGKSEEDRADSVRRQIRAFLVERGYFEALSGALVRAEEGEATRLTLAAGPDAAGYRQSLLPGLGRAAGRNLSRGEVDLKLFEIGRVSVAGGREEVRLALLVSGRERPVNWQEEDLDTEEWETLEEAADQAEVHPLYQASFELTIWLDEALQARGEEAASHPASLELLHQASIMGGKLAAALSDPESTELGMTIAYLKRALRAVNLALNAYAEIHREKVFGRTRDRHLRDQLFSVRGGIVKLMGEVRAEWRRRQAQ
jgi:hypothetical protein